MKSIGAQLLVTLAVTAVATWFFIHRGPPPWRDICDATADDDCRSIRCCVAWGVSPSRRPSPNHLPPIYYALSGKGPAIDTLAELGADLDDRSLGSKHTPLIWATMPPKPGIVQRLLQNGADPSFAAHGHLTALHSSVMHPPLKAIGHKPNLVQEQRRLDVVTLLLDAQANIEAKWASVTPLYLAVEMQHGEIARLLIQRGANVNARTRWPSEEEATDPRSGDTPLHAAVDNGDSDLATALLAASAGPDLANDAGRTPVHYAAKCDSPELLWLLASKGGRVNARDKSGATPLHAAATSYSDDGKCIATLIALGADLNTPDHNGETPLAVAIKDGGSIDIDMLRKHGATE